MKMMFSDRVMTLKSKVKVKYILKNLSKDSKTNSFYMFYVCFI